MTTTTPPPCCFTCYRPVADKDGFVCVDSHLASTEQSTPVSWECYHYRCDPGEDNAGDYWIALDRLALDRHGDETDDWSRHLSGKDWIEHTDWRTCPIPALVRLSGGSVTNVLPFPGSHPATEDSTVMDIPASDASAAPRSEDDEDDETPTTT